MALLGPSRGFLRAFRQGIKAKVLPKKTLSRRVSGDLNKTLMI